MDTDQKIELPGWVHGIDFSGAQDAGKKIWISSGHFTGGVLELGYCSPAEELAGSGRDRDRCLEALWQFIGVQQTGAFGLDFPFGLPHELVKEATWEEFVLSFGERYPNHTEFREACRAAARGREIKRLTDKESRTPFSPYNLRLYRQTYFGIRDVLAPLVRDRSVCVLPMQSASPRSPWVLEICPASTLKQLGLYMSYKGPRREHNEARARILSGIEATGALSIQASRTRSKIVADQNGDALDSVVAAVATSRALRNLADNSARGTGAAALEGHVYV